MNETQIILLAFVMLATAEMGLGIALMIQQARQAGTSRRLFDKSDVKYTDGDNT